MMEHEKWLADSGKEHDEKKMSAMRRGEYDMIEVAKKHLADLIKRDKELQKELETLRSERRSKQPTVDDARRRELEQKLKEDKKEIEATRVKELEFLNGRHFQHAQDDDPPLLFDNTPPKIPSSKTNQGKVAPVPGANTAHAKNSLAKDDKRDGHVQDGTTVVAKLKNPGGTPAPSVPQDKTVPREPPVSQQPAVQQHSQIHSYVQKEIHDVRTQLDKLKSSQQSNVPQRPPPPAPPANLVPGAGTDTQSASKHKSVAPPQANALRRHASISPHPADPAANGAHAAAAQSSQQSSNNPAHSVQASKTVPQTAKHDSDVIRGVTERRDKLRDELKDLEEADAAEAAAAAKNVLVPETAPSLRQSSLKQPSTNSAAHRAPAAAAQSSQQSSKMQNPPGQPPPPPGLPPTDSPASTSQPSKVQRQASVPAGDAGGKAPPKNPSEFYPAFISDVEDHLSPEQRASKFKAQMEKELEAAKKKKEDKSKMDAAHEAASKSAPTRQAPVLAAPDPHVARPAPTLAGGPAAGPTARVREPVPARNKVTSKQVQDMLKNIQEKSQNPPAGGAAPAAPGAAPAAAGVPANQYTVQRTEQAGTAPAASVRQESVKAPPHAAGATGLLHAHGPGPAHAAHTRNDPEHVPTHSLKKLSPEEDQKLTEKFKEIARARAAKSQERKAALLRPQQAESQGATTKPAPVAGQDKPAGGAGAAGDAEFRRPSLVRQDAMKGALVPKHESPYVVQNKEGLKRSRSDLGEEGVVSTDESKKARSQEATSKNPENVPLVPTVAPKKAQSQVATHEPAPVVGQEKYAAGAGAHKQQIVPKPNRYTPDHAHSHAAGDADRPTERGQPSAQKSVEAAQAQAENKSPSTKIHPNKDEINRRLADFQKSLDSQKEQNKKPLTDTKRAFSQDSERSDNSFSRTSSVDSNASSLSRDSSAGSKTSGLSSRDSSASSAGSATSRLSSQPSNSAAGTRKRLFILSFNIPGAKLGPYTSFRTCARMFSILYTLVIWSTVLRYAERPLTSMLRLPVSSHV